jgi:hypothetical protein
MLNSRNENSFLGAIVAHRGSLEYEIFRQTLASFSELSDNQLPKGNERFSDVLALWESRVVDSAEGRRKEVLLEQCRSIRHYQDFRNALAHGMWNWPNDAPHKITATRIRKNEVKSTTFTADDLESFALALATINFNVRYPGGREEYAQEMANTGAYMSRRAVRLMTGK